MSCAAVPGGASTKNTEASRAAAGFSPTSVQRTRTSRRAVAALRHQSGSLSAATVGPSTRNTGAAIHACTASR